MKTSQSWKTFYVISTGRRCRAHEELVDKFKSLGHSEVPEADGCDYYLVFCPITSRVGTDITEAQSKIPGDKSAVLIVMHHTYNKDYVLANSERLADKPNVVLTVDVLFHQEKLLLCQHNDRAWDTIQTSLCGNPHKWNVKKWVFFGVVGVLAISGISALIYELYEYTHHIP